MASRFDFQSPGAAFTAEISKALAERKAEERQRLIDSLSFSADQRAQEAAALNKQQTEAAMQSQKQQDEIARANALTANMTRGSGVENLSPADQELLVRYNRVNKRPVADVATDETFTDASGNPTINDEQGSGEAGSTMPPAVPVARSAAKPVYEYVGSTKEQEEEKDKIAAGKLIAGLMSDPNNKSNMEIGAFLQQYADTHHGVIPGEVMAQLLGPKKHVKIFNEPTGKFTDGGEIGPSDQVIQRGYAPGAGQGLGLQFAGNDRESGDSVFFDKYGRKHSMSGVGRGPDPDAAPLNISTKAVEDHALNFQMLHPDETGKIDPMQMASYRQTAMQIIQQAKTTSEVRHLAATFVQNPAAYAQARQNANLSEKELRDLQIVLTMAAPPGTAELFRLNPVPKFLGGK